MENMDLSRLKREYSLLKMMVQNPSEEDKLKLDSLRKQIQLYSEITPK